MAKYSVHIPEQTILVDTDQMDSDSVTYPREPGHELIMWHPLHGAFANTNYTFNRVSD